MVHHFSIHQQYEVSTQTEVRINETHYALVVCVQIMIVVFSGSIDLTERLPQGSSSQAVYLFFALFLLYCKHKFALKRTTLKSQNPLYDRK